MAITVVKLCESSIIERKSDTARGYKTSRMVGGSTTRITIASTAYGCIYNM